VNEMSAEICNSEQQPGSRISGAPLRKSSALHRVRDTRFDIDRNRSIR
jgi:hypothetical protein